MNPFKVLCVAEAIYDVVTGQTEPSPIHVLSEYTVINEGYASGMLLYQLAGQDPDTGFDARCFATLPEATADEMQEAEREAILV